MAPRIALVGSGNVATHLAGTLAPYLCGIYSRTAQHAGALASRMGVPVHGQLADVAGSGADVIIISVADQAIVDVAEEIGPVESMPLVLHTSGTIAKEALARISPRTGVLYPLQTFSRDVPVDMATMPFFIETAQTSDKEIAASIGHLMSPHIHYADAARRRTLHIAGVFTSNFTNVLLEAVERILAPHDYSLDVVRPLAEATIAKAFRVGPHAAQTGPARRRDDAVIAAQSEAIADPTLREAYDVLTRLIIQYQDGQYKK